MQTKYLTYLCLKKSHFKQHIYEKKYAKILLVRIQYSLLFVDIAKS